jgi:hypothetical protein
MLFLFEASSSFEAETLLETFETTLESLEPLVLEAVSMTNYDVRLRNTPQKKKKKKKKKKIKMLLE